MSQLGWSTAADEDSGEPVLVLARAATMAHVREIQAAAERAKKADEARAKALRRAAASSGDLAREALRAQLHADKQERATRGPVEVGSVAQKLPSEAGTGPRVAGCKDAGIQS